MQRRHYTSSEDEPKPSKRRKLLPKYKKPCNSKTIPNIEDKLSNTGKNLVPVQETYFLYKSPERLRPEGLVAKIDRQNIHDMIFTELRNFHNHNKPICLFEHLETIFQRMKCDSTAKSGDYAVMTLVQGCRAASWLTNEPRKAIRRYKRLKGSLFEYNLQHSDVVKALLLYNYFVLYMDKNKPGKAYAAMQHAKSCLSEHFPSTWTSLLLKMECRMYDRLVQIRVKNRSQWQKMAVDSYRLARSHSLEQDNGLYFPIMYTVDIMYITMDMPTIDTTRDFRDTEIILERLNNFKISNPMIDEAGRMLQDVSDKITTLCPSYQYKTNERIFYIGNIYFNIRKAQLLLSSDNNRDESMKYLEQGLEVYKMWSIDSGQNKDSEFQYCPNLAKNIKYFLDRFYHDLLVIMDVGNLCKQSTTASDTPISVTSDTISDIDEEHDSRRSNCPCSVANIINTFSKSESDYSENGGINAELEGIALNSGIDSGVDLSSE